MAQWRPTELQDRHLVAIGWAGAYAASMAMAYNGRPAAPQVLIEGDGRLTLGRRRGRATLRVG